MLRVSGGEASLGSELRGGGVRVDGETEELHGFEDAGACSRLGL